MTFARANWSRQSSAQNTGKDDGINGPALFTYWSSTDNAAAIGGANYFSAAAFDLAPGDFIFSNASDAFSSVRVVAVDRTVTPATITTETVGLATAIGTANIVDGAVTSAKLDATLVRYARVSVSLADFIGSNTAPVEILAAPGAGLKYVLHRACLGVDYGGTVLAAGGTVQFAYGTAAGVAGAIATNTLAAATLIAATADTMFGFEPVETTLTDALTVNEPLSLSTETADFTGGTGSTYEVDVWYSIVPQV